MTITAAQLKTWIAEAVQSCPDPRIADHIRAFLVEPSIELRDWDHGAPGQRYRCWIVFKHPGSNTAIAYCEQGFGPRHPWGLMWIGGDDVSTSMGEDFCWYRTFMRAYLDSQAVCELPIWRVYWTDPSGVKQPLTEEGTWADIWDQVEAMRQKDPDSQFDCDTELAVILRAEGS